MGTATDDSLLPRRRTIERAALAARGIGLIGTLTLVSGLTVQGSPPAMSGAMRVACWFGIGAMAEANLLAWFGARRPQSAWYQRFSAIQVALDTLTIVAVVVVSARETPQTTWPLLSVTIAVAAIRHRLLGAMVVYAATTAIFLVAVPESPDHAFVAGVNIMIALITGTQSSAFARQLTALQETRRALHHQAHHDALTGLPNRAQLAGHAADRTGASLAVLLLDLNGFKQINDTYGHAAGDLLLHEVGARLATLVRDGDDGGDGGERDGEGNSDGGHGRHGDGGPDRVGGGFAGRVGGGLAGRVGGGFADRVGGGLAGRVGGDLAGRLGGDEFLVLLPGADAERAARVAGRIRDAIRRPVRIGDGREVTVGVSVGVAVRPAGSDAGLDVLTAEADAAMYRDKRRRAA